MCTWHCRMQPKNGSMVNMETGWWSVHMAVFYIVQKFFPNGNSTTLVYLNDKDRLISRASHWVIFEYFCTYCLLCMIIPCIKMWSNLYAQKVWYKTFALDLRNIAQSSVNTLGHFGFICIIAPYTVPYHNIRNGPFEFGIRINKRMSNKWYFVTCTYRDSF